MTANSTIFLYLELTGDAAGVARASVSATHKEPGVQKDSFEDIIPTQLCILRSSVDILPPTRPSATMGTLGSLHLAGSALLGACNFTRSDPLQCIIYITGGDGWGVSQGRESRCLRHHPRHAEKHDLQYARDDGRGKVLFKVLELAFSVFGLDAWTELTHTFPKHLLQDLSVPVVSSDSSKLRMYWWTPDDSFLDIAPQPFILPPQNKFAYSQGDVTTSSERIEVTKIISSDLEFMAPDFVKLLQNSQPRRRIETVPGQTS